MDGEGSNVFPVVVSGMTMAGRGAGHGRHGIIVSFRTAAPTDVSSGAWRGRAPIDWPGAGRSPYGGDGLAIPENRSVRYLNGRSTSGWKILLAVCGARKDYVYFDTCRRYLIESLHCSTELLEEGHGGRDRRCRLPDRRASMNIQPSDA